MHIRVDHAKLKAGVQAKQAQGEDFTNLVWIKASPGASHHHPCFLFWIITFMLRMIVN
jgi:hypothetical protein